MINLFRYYKVFLILLFIVRILKNKLESNAYLNLVWLYLVIGLEI